MPGGVRVIGLPANPQTARGFTGDVLLDEFAKRAEDREVWAVLRGHANANPSPTRAVLNHPIRVI